MRSNATPNLVLNARDPHRYEETQRRIRKTLISLGYDVNPSGMIRFVKAA